LVNTLYAVISLRRIFISISTVVLILLVWVFSPATIIPPADPEEAIAVYIIEMGLHPEVVLPHPQDGLMRYAYGDWNYFALNQQALNDAVAALFTPTPGTLGRSTLSNVEELRQLVTEKNANLLSLEVAQDKAFKLAQSLDERFAKNIATRTQNPQTGLSLVKDEQEYTVLHNSNHELVVWLEQLGCQVKGFVMWANFQVRNS
jgi:hypothetical protein